MDKAYVLKVRCGSDTYVKRDGKIGTAGKGALVSEDVTFTLSTTQDQTLFAPVDFRHGSVGGTDDAANTLQAKSTGGYSLNYQPGVMDADGYVVRRLTPLECERLQAFDDGWTDLTGEDAEAILERMPQHRQSDEKGQKALERKVRKWCDGCPDGPRYKAIGNSFTTSVVRWLGERIQAVADAVGASEGAPTSFGE